MPGRVTSTPAPSRHPQVRVRSAHRLATPTVHRPSRATRGRRMRAAARTRHELADAREAPAPWATHGPVATPGHPVAASAWPSQAVLRSSRSRLVALDLLSMNVATLADMSTHRAEPSHTAHAPRLREALDRRGPSRQPRRFSHQPRQPSSRGAQQLEQMRPLDECTRPSGRGANAAPPTGQRGADGAILSTAPAPAFAGKLVMSRLRCTMGRDV